MTTPTCHKIRPAVMTSRSAVLKAIWLSGIWRWKTPGSTSVSLQDLAISIFNLSYKVCSFIIINFLIRKQLLMILIPYLVVFLIMIWLDDLSIMDWSWCHLTNTLRQKTETALVQEMTIRLVQSDVWTVVDWSLGINFSENLLEFEPFHWK